MAIQRIGPKSAPRPQRRLIEAIKKEMRRPEEVQAPRDAPRIILEEESGAFGNAHYYVIRDRFRGMDEDFRSHMVFQAVKEELGDTKAMRTTIAMGPTREEAKEMFPHLLRA